MDNYSFGPQLNGRRVAALLGCATLLLTLFVVRCYKNTLVQEPVAAPAITEQHIYISEYDSLFRVYADSLHDWKMLAAIAYVESKFDSTAASGAGPTGIMQVMPSTCKSMLGYANSDTLVMTNELNIKAAALYLDYLDNQFSFINPTERIKFVLGSYNSGPGHVFDAMRVARRDGINRYLWSNIDTLLLTLSQEEVHSDTTIVHAGPFQGKETVRYVRSVMKKYQEYNSMDLLFRAAELLVTD